MIFRGLRHFLPTGRRRLALGAVAVLLAVGLGVLWFRTSAPNAEAELAAAEQAIHKGDYKAAAVFLQNAAREVPYSAGIRLRLAEVYMRLGRYPAAEAWARLARESGANVDRVDPLLAEALLQQNKFTTLIKLVPPGTRDPKAEAAVRVTLGLAHLYLGDVDLGAQFLADAQRLDPATPRLPLGLARLDLIKGNLAGAEVQLRAALKTEAGTPDVARLDSDVLRLKGDLDGAIAVLSKILAKNPNDLATLVARVDVLIVKGDLKDAQKDVDRALRIAPGSPTPSFLNALLVARSGNFVKADELLTAISEQFPSLPAGYYLQGVVKYALGQYSIAEDSLTHYLGRRPDDTAALRLLAAIAVRQKDYGRAITLLQRAVTVDPGDGATIVQLAKAYLAVGRRDDVVALYEKAAKARPNDPRRQTEAALMRIRYGDADAGLSQLDAIAKTSSGLASAGPVVVLAALDAGDVKKAAVTAEALVRQDGSDLIAQNLLGMVRVAQLKPAEAEQIFNAIIAKAPDFLAVRHNLATVYLATGRIDAARQVYEAVLQRQPQDLESLESLADIAAASDDVGTAAALLHRAMAAAPDQPDPESRLVKLYAQRKDWKDALAAAQDLVKRFPRDEAAVDLDASVHAASGDTAGAVAVFFPFTQWYPKSANLLLRFASYQIKDGDIAGARKSLEHALVLQPDEAKVMATLVHLDYATKSPEAGLATARSFAAQAPIVSDLLAAEVLERMNRRDEAIAVLTKGQKLHPATDIVIRLAALTDAKGQRAAAEALLRSWLAQHDKDLATELALANDYMLDRAYDKAQPLYEAAVQQAPTNAIAANNLAWIYARAHDPRANDLAQRAFHLAPGGVTADTLGWTLLRDGDAKAGLPLLKSAGAALPGDMSVQYHLAVALEVTGDTQQARSLLERVIASRDTFDGKDDAERRLGALQGN
ncbi:MAG TPA: XrtA/PEP-CTERM system TPR-repeat protein PrsT [Stellaceae bacterium]|nr:XrtA/PEP-CTERM system TPR-repeat protein PrsT [Stellaceae bacterium]